MVESLTTKTRSHCAAVRRRSLHRRQRGTRPRVLHGRHRLARRGTGTVTGVDNIVPVLGGFIGALSDIQATVQDAIASDDLVALRLVVTATHTGNLLGVPATGRPVRWDAVDIYRITDDGRISEQWAFEDLAAILSQVGAIALPWAG